MCSGKPGPSSHTSRYKAGKSGSAARRRPSHCTDRSRPLHRQRFSPQAPAGRRISGSPRPLHPQARRPPSQVRRPGTALPRSGQYSGESHRQAYSKESGNRRRRHRRSGGKPTRSGRYSLLPGLLSRLWTVCRYRHSSPSQMYRENCSRGPAPSGKASESASPHPASAG